MIRITTPVDPSWSRANERAIEDIRAGRLAVRVSANVYTVPSSSSANVTYRVTIHNVGKLEASCDCDHGRAGRTGHCRHIAQSLGAEIERVSRKAVPAAAPAPAAPRVTPGEFAARFSRV
jgi:hypothetical protein